MRTYLPQILLVLACLAILYASLGPLLLQPNAYMLHNDGDGIKNYFTPAYYLRYNQGLRFEGMNHPYGEHVVFTDNQPIISLLLNEVDDHLFEVWPYTVGILNVLLFLSIPFCALLLYAIGRHYYLSKPYAVIVALLITFLSPQLYRFSGHYALAYACFVPWIWWIMIQLDGAQGRTCYRWWGIWLLSMCFFGLTHVYYLLMGVIMTLSYQLLTQLLYGGKHTWRNLAIAVGTSLLPLVLFKVFLALTDGAGDRPSSPYGFYTYKAYWESLFMPPHGPVRAFIDRVIPIRVVPGESIAYAGFLSFLVLLASIGRLVGWAWRGRFKKWIYPALPDRLNVATWAGLLVLFFSMGIPFVWGLDVLLDVLTPLKQFRSLGRFAWVPYYLFSMYAAVYLFLIYRLLKQRSLVRFSFWLLGIALLFWSWEVIIHQQSTLHHLGKQELPNLFQQPTIDYNDWLAEHELAPEDFQAILPLPVFFIGSEKFIPEFPHPDASRQSFLAAFQTGLPLACGMMSRTSLSQSLKLVQLMSNPLLEKRILQEYPTDKPLLLLAVKDVVLTVNEQAVLAKGELLGERENIRLYRLDLSAFAREDEPVVARWEARKDSLIPHPSGLWVSEDSIPLHYDAFDQQPGSAFGEETLSDPEGPLTIMDKALEQVEVGEWMQWSLYVKADGKRDAFPVVIFRELDVHGKEVQRAELNPKFGLNIYKDWVLLQHEFKLQHPDHKINLFTSGIFPEVESLLVRPLDVDVYKPSAGGAQLMYNNYYFP